MSNTFIKDLRRTDNSFYNNRNIQSARSNSKNVFNNNSNRIPIMINYQKRQKLRELLISKFMKKYNLKTYEPLIDDEVTYFLHKESLTERDLKELDNKINDLLSKKDKLNNLASNYVDNSSENKINNDYNKNNLNNNINKNQLKSYWDEREEYFANNNNNNKTNSRPPSVYSNTKSNKYNNSNKVKTPSERSIKSASQREKINLPECNSKINSNYINQDLNKSVKSGISGASKLSNVARKKKEIDIDDLELLSESNEPIERIKFPEGVNEWDAINKYNQQVFEKEKIDEFMKDKEIKRRTKEDLDNQIKQKLLRINEEKCKEKEYDRITKNHVETLNKLEEQRRKELKDKQLREKNSRDAQRLDEKKHKKLEQLKNKKYDNQLLKYINEEIEKEKISAIDKKIADKEELKKTLKENEENKKLQAIAKENERIDDIKAIEDYTKVLDKQENERKLYFKNIENKANNFLAKMSATVLKDIENKNKEENEKFKKYEQEKESRLVAKDLEHAKMIKQGKREIKSFLDKQIEEKRKEKELQDKINKEQAKIWNKDKTLQVEQERNINDKIRAMNEYNQEILRAQMDMRKEKLSNKGMSDGEYLMNKKLIENASKLVNKK